ncbi:hypothetical protein DY023_16185 [Microbacterium bovistercoris]|uniref:Uncharacterized protein n=1 Tax=Microbacterium bovistercoris TaxID=2293570 RepID=A0A371NNV0_9MICO|nr:hypothetical protein DY023_16185 [Microbacterium bovistercoris]
MLRRASPRRASPLPPRTTTRTRVSHRCGTPWLRRAAPTSRTRLRPGPTARPPRPTPIPTPRAPTRTPASTDPSPRMRGQKMRYPLTRTRHILTPHVGRRRRHAGEVVPDGLAGDRRVIRPGAVG